MSAPLSNITECDMKEIIVHVYKHYTCVIKGGVGEVQRYGTAETITITVVNKTNRHVYKCS